MNEKCKICRRLGEKLFLKGERCFTPKCAIVKRAYGPGPKSKRRISALSEYGVQLREKQRVKEIYGLRERQFKNYVVKAMAKKSPKNKSEVKDAAIQEKSFPDFLVESLEQRLDNVVFRMGIANSRKAARQMVVHGHFMVNNHGVSKPSYQLRIGDIVSIKTTSLAKKVFQDLKLRFVKHEFPSWVGQDKEKIEGKINALPVKEEANIPVDLKAVGEFYSR